VPRDLAKVAIESGYYHLKAANLTAQVREAQQHSGSRCGGRTTAAAKEVLRDRSGHRPAECSVLKLMSVC
jgi:hypothetical protein